MRTRLRRRPRPGHEIGHLNYQATAPADATQRSSDATEAHPIGLIQEITKPSALLDRAVELAESIATPLRVRATLASVQRALTDGHEVAAARLTDEMAALFRTKDGAEGMTSFIERRPANFTGG